MVPIEHILVPTDFSEPSENALALALDIARAFQARVTLLHAWSIPETAYLEAVSWPIDELQQAAQSSLDQATARAKVRYPKVDAVLREGKDWRVVLDVVKSSGCDLVVMGTHGRRGLPRLVLGSVAEKVVRLAAVPVMTVPKA